MSYPYPKIPALYKRDPADPKKILYGEFKDPTVKYLMWSEWIFTEKVDGTNMRIVWNGENVTIKGRNEKSQVPDSLVDFMSYYESNEFVRKLQSWFGPTPATIYGEGYGAKIQKGGGDYIPDDVSFIAFDVLLGQRYWMSYSEVYDLTTSLNILMVPVNGICVLVNKVAEMKNNEIQVSQLRSTPAEGLVGQPRAQLLNASGKLIRVKLKVAQL